MPDSFTLFPSEALRIGRYFAEWEPREDIVPIYCGPTFVEWFRRHLGRTVPEMLSSKQVNLTPNDIPADVVWSSISPLGLRESSPNWAYFRHDDTVTATMWD